MKASHLILVAGGKGLRMGTATPKQFLNLEDRPLIIHTIERFQSAMPDLDIVLVLPESHMEHWQAIQQNYLPHSTVKIAYGGDTRYHSVNNGWGKIAGKEGDIVGVHDAVRPFVSKKVIATCFKTAKEHGAAIPVVPLKESIRTIDDNGTSKAVERDQFRIVQTPQCFEWTILKRAYEQPCDTSITDDAALVEKMGQEIYCVEGNNENRKITGAEDWEIAKVLLNKAHQKD